MAAFPAAFVFFLYLNLISGYVLLGDEENENEIVWPTEYHFNGEKLDFATTLKTPFEIWYSAEQNRSRIDFCGGSNKKYFYADEGYVYTIFPMTEIDMTPVMYCDVEFTSEEQLDFLPDVELFTFTGQTMNLLDKVVDVWTSTEVEEANILKEETLYVFKTDSGYDLPVQHIVKKIYVEQGEIASHRVTNYYNFRSSASLEELTTEESSCQEFGRQGHNFKTDMMMLHPDLPHDLDIAFESFANHHNKQYQQNEKLRRKTIFENNWRMVHEHNRKNLGFKLKLNEFSDRTPEELQYLTGTFISKKSAEDVQPFPHTLEEVDDLVRGLPQNFDWRIEGYVTPVKNQAACGSCWAFATTAAVEGAISRVNGDRLLDLSEQSLVDCAWNDDNMGCHGGTLDGAMRYVFENGIPTEREYGLYTAKDGYCDILNMTTTYKIKGFTQVTPHSPNALKVALYKYGPATVAIHASDLMKHYSSGVFYDISCEDSHPNHGVTVVGYGTRDGDDYWLVKNSWGEGWGEDGYILMSARDNNCFVLDSPYYPVV